MPDLNQPPRRLDETADLPLELFAGEDLPDGGPYVGEVEEVGEQVRSLRRWPWLALVAVAMCGVGSLGLVGVLGGVAKPFLDRYTTPTVAVEAPDELDGHPRLTDEDTAVVADSMVVHLGVALPAVTGTASGFYGDPSQHQLVLAAAVTGRVADPSAALDRALSELAADLPTSGLQAIEPGPLGGVVKCGTGKVGDTPVSVCIWADEGSLGLIVDYFSTAAALQAEFPALRGQIER